jgi:hypothetical protein
MFTIACWIIFIMATWKSSSDDLNISVTLGLAPTNCLVFSHLGSFWSHYDKWFFLLKLRHY